MVYCYQLASLIQIPQPPVTGTDENQLSALRGRVENLLMQLGVADDQKMVDWLQQRLGRLEQRDTAMLHRLLHDIEKIGRVKCCHTFLLWCNHLILRVDFGVFG